MKNNKAIVINLFAGPGSGKSTTAAGIFYELKSKGINCELVTEYAKAKVWEESFTTLDDQLYVFAKQQHRIFTTADKVDVIITDSPIALSLYYGQHLSENFTNLVKETFNQYNNVNYYIGRVKAYNPIGRFQNEEEAREIDVSTFNLLTKHDIPFIVTTGDRVGLDFIVKNTLKALNKEI